MNKYNWRNRRNSYNKEKNNKKISDKKQCKSPSSTKSKIKQSVWKGDSLGQGRNEELRKNKTMNMIKNSRWRRYGHGKSDGNWIKYFAWDSYFFEF